MSSLALNHGYPDRVGKRFIFSGAYQGGATAPATGGPSSYTTGGDPMVLPGFQNYIDSLQGGIITVSGTYILFPVSDGVGPRANWKFKWFTYAPIAGTLIEVAAATNLSAEQVQVSGFGGVY